MNRQDATLEIKARIDCRDYLKPSKGKLYCCPFCHSGEHNSRDSDGAVQYHADTNRWNCNACGRHGTVIDLYMERNGVDFKTAVNELAEELRITIDPWRSSPAEDFRTPHKPAAAPQTGGNPSFKGTGTPEPQAVTDYTEYLEKCMANLAESDAAQAYLEKRGISLETAATCCIGFDPAWRSPTAIERGKNPPASPRIIAPSCKTHYVARDIRPDLDGTQKKFAKMNEGTPQIMGAQVLYSGAESIFVVEGCFDALSIIEVGQPAIALNSAGNAGKLIEMLERRSTAATLILCLDDDAAGKNATKTLKEGLERLNISWTQGNINCGQHDPNDALTADRAAFEQAIAQAIAGTAAKPDSTMVYLDTIMGDDIARRQAIGKKPTGLKNLDDATGGGLRPGLYLIGAGTSIGKTTFCSQLADGLAENGSDVIYFSLEQSRLEMMAKTLSRGTAKIDMKRAVTGTAIMDGYTPQIVLDAARKHKEMAGDRLSIIEAGFNADADYITDYVRRYVKRNGTRPVVFVDYLQILLPGDVKRTDKREAVEEALSKLVLLKRELDLTIIAIVSLNRSSYLNPFDFESIKETGLAEFSADVVWGLQLACFDDPLFDEEKKLKQKRAMIKAAKAEIPRKIKLVSLKHRGQQAIYDCNFIYYPQYDLFIPAQAPAGTTPKAGRKL